MGKTLVWLAGGLVFGAAVVAWLLPENEVVEDSAVAASPRNDSELVTDVRLLAARVGELEDQVSRLMTALEGLGDEVADQANRADSVEAARAADLRAIEQRLATTTQGAGPGMPPNGSLPNGWAFQSGGPNGMRMVLQGPDGTPVVVTPESSAAANNSGQPFAAPPNLTGIEAQPGQALIFRVTGANEGTVWGTDSYTDDSSIAAAAVHAGVLQPGETGVVMLTLQEGAPSYTGTPRFGVNSENYGDWGRSYAIQRLY